MARSPSNPGQAEALRPSFKALGKPIVEWLFWIGLAIFAYAQTGNFDKEIAEYAFGASGWPRSLCLAIALGATGQLAYQALSIARAGKAHGDDPESEHGGERMSVWRLAQRLGIFVLPLVYLYVMPSVGFYVATPVFILGLLLLLEVKSPVALLTVTVVVYGLVLLIFTRFFYVALPVGNAAGFYDLNNAIIGLARSGM